MANFINEIDKLNSFELMKAQLVTEIKTRITNDLIQQEVADFEAKIRPKIESLVGSITFDSIKTFEDYLNMKNELKVYISINGKTQAQKYFGAN